MTDARALAGRSGMPVRETASDGVPVGKKPQTGIEVKKSVGLAHIQTTRSGGAARQAEVKFSQRSLRRARSQGNIQITFYLAARPQRARRGKNGPPDKLDFLKDALYHKFIEQATFSSERKNYAIKSH